MSKRITLDNFVTIDKDSIEYAMYKTEGAQEIDKNLYVLEVGLKSGKTLWLGFIMLSGLHKALKKLR